MATAAIGALLGIGVSMAIALLYSAVRKVDGFGGGDVKLLGAMGVFLGPYVLLAFFVGSVLGALYGIIADGCEPSGTPDEVPVRAVPRHRRGSDGAVGPRRMARCTRPAVLARVLAHAFSFRLRATVLAA